jgi:hypothetical protein
VNVCSRSLPESLHRRRRNRGAAAIDLRQTGEVAPPNVSALHKRNESRNRRGGERRFPPFDQPQSFRGIKAVEENNRYSGQHPQCEMRNQTGDMKQRRQARDDVLVAEP